LTARTFGSWGDQESSILDIFFGWEMYLTRADFEWKDLNNRALCNIIGNNKMVQNIIHIDEKEDRVINIVKAKHGLKTKSEAIALITQTYEKNFLEPELRPEYLEKLNKIEKEGYGEVFSSVDELRKKIEA
jgi:hypothetical protein